jgi:hypothetical protein
MGDRPRPDRSAEATIIRIVKGCAGNQQSTVVKPGTRWIERKRLPSFFERVGFERRDRPDHGEHSGRREAHPVGHTPAALRSDVRRRIGWARDPVWIAVRPDLRDNPVDPSPAPRRCWGLTRSFPGYPWTSSLHSRVGMTGRDAPGAPRPRGATWLREAGLPGPTLIQQVTVRGGAAVRPICEYSAEMVRIPLSPREAFGIATAEEVQVETLIDRLGRASSPCARSVQRFSDLFPGKKILYDPLDSSIRIRRFKP